MIRRTDAAGNETLTIIIVVKFFRRFSSLEPLYSYLKFFNMLNLAKSKVFRFILLF